MKKSGTGAGIRTQDPRFRRPMLYPAELLPHKEIECKICNLFQWQIIKITN